jgi:hypothetical protein
MNLIHPATMDLANQVITLDEPTGEAFTLILNRDAAIHLQSLPRRMQAQFGRAVKVKSRPLECYYWNYLVPLIKKHFGELFTDDADDMARTVTEYEAHRAALDKVGERDRFGRVITSSEPEFDLYKQMGFIEAVRRWLELSGVPTIDPMKNWREAA